MTIDTPRRVETYTTDVTFNVGFTRSVCKPKSRGDVGILQGGSVGLPAVWLRLEQCLVANCSGVEVWYIYKLTDFYTSPSTTVSVPCRFWGWPGTYRVKVGAEVTDVDAETAVVAASNSFQVAWSTDYDIRDDVVG